MGLISISSLIILFTQVMDNFETVISTYITSISDFD